MNAILEPAQMQDISVLIVDDEISIQKLLSRILTAAGFHTAKAGNGQEAIEILGTLDADVVITDITMPQMDGLELTEQIKARFQSDVIVITGQTDQYHYEELIRLGASDFIQKPITPDEIVLRVKRVLRERQLKADLVKYHEDLAQAQKFESIGLLAAGIAHEINTPIQYIGDNTLFMKDSFEDLTDVVGEFKQFIDKVKHGQINDEMIEKMETTLEKADIDYLSEEIPIAVSQTLDGVQRVRKIVSSMKEFSHPGTQEKIMADIHHTIENTVTVAINEWKYCADLTLDFAPDMPLIRCDASELSQVFLNMIINAAHSIIEKNGPDQSEKGKIRISTSKNDRWVKIKIYDTGKGIAKENINKVFDPFFTTKEVGKGTGQGLAISRRVVVDHHHGRLDIETQQGVGTCFIIKLPLQENT